MGTGPRAPPAPSSRGQQRLGSRRPRYLSHLSAPRRALHPGALPDRELLPDGSFPFPFHCTEAPIRFGAKLNRTQNAGMRGPGRADGRTRGRRPGRAVLSKTSAQAHSISQELTAIGSTSRHRGWGGASGSPVQHARLLCDPPDPKAPEAQPCPYVVAAGAVPPPVCGLVWVDFPSEPTHSRVCSAPRDSFKHGPAMPSWLHAPRVLSSTQGWALLEGRV